jgi:hypothetical protein
LAQQYNRQYFYQLILDSLAEGLNDHEIIKRLHLSNRTYYRYKNALADKISYFQTKVSDSDIALAQEIYEMRTLNAYRKAMEKLDKSDDPEWLLSAMQLATNLLQLKRNGLVEATSKRAKYVKLKEQQKMLEKNDGCYNTVF